LSCAVGGSLVHPAIRSIAINAKQGSLFSFMLDLLGVARIIQSKQSDLKPVGLIPPEASTLLKTRQGRSDVIPAQAGIQPFIEWAWTPACAGVT
jgi:hypothetical protein